MNYLHFIYIQTLMLRIILQVIKDAENLVGSLYRVAASIKTLQTLLVAPLSFVPSERYYSFHGDNFYETFPCFGYSHALYGFADFPRLLRANVYLPTTSSDMNCTIECTERIPELRHTSNTRVLFAPCNTT